MNSFRNLRSLCTLLMCDDPTNLSQEDRDDLEKWVNQEARDHGFDDWVDAYHWERPRQNETPGTEAPGASTENPFPVANCEKRLSEPEALSSSADKNRQKLRPLVVKTIGTVDLVELAMGWLRYQALRSVAEPNFDERVDMLLVEKEGL